MCCGWLSQGYSAGRPGVSAGAAGTPQRRLRAPQLESTAAACRSPCACPLPAAAGRARRAPKPCVLHQTARLVSVHRAPQHYAKTTQRHLARLCARWRRTAPGCGAPRQQPAERRALSAHARSTAAPRHPARLSACIICVGSCRGAPAASPGIRGVKRAVRCGRYRDRGGAGSKHRAQVEPRVANSRMQDVPCNEGRCASEDQQTC